MNNKFTEIIEPVKKQIEALSGTNQKIYNRSEFERDPNLQEMFRNNLAAQVDCILNLTKVGLL